MPKSRHARIRPGWILTLLLAILIMASALVACSNTVPDDEPPDADGLFRSVSVGQWHTCGVRRDGSVDCWGANDSLSGRSIGQATPPAGSFVSVSAGSLHTCGVRSNASVDCWGYDIAGQATPPAGPFVSVNAGGYILAVLGVTAPSPVGAEMTTAGPWCPRVPSPRSAPGVSTRAGLGATALSPAGALVYTAKPPRPRAPSPRSAPGRGTRAG